MNRFIALLLLSLLAFSTHSHAQDTPSRVALVIGNSAYENVPTLRNPSNDASDIAAALSQIGFDVSLHLDVDDVEMRRAVRDFAKVSDTADISVVYFAGHGIEIEKKNFLLPIDAELQSDGDAELEAVQLSSLVRAVSGGNGVTLVLVDACRTNPFVERLIGEEATRSIGQGLVRVEMVGGALPGGTLISYAAREGTIAFDGVGRNSPYAQGFLEQLEYPGLEVSKLFRKVRDRVFVLTEGQQEPFTYGALPGTDIFLHAQYSGESKSLEEDGLQNPQALRDFYRAEWTNTAIAWREFLTSYDGASVEAELLEIARQRLISLGGDALLRTLEKEDEPWLVPVAGLPKNGPVSLNLEERRLVQKALLYMGFDIGQIDGQFGNRTNSAIALARIQAGLPLNIEVDRHLLARLPNVPAIDALISREAVVLETSDWSDVREPRLSRALASLQGQLLVFDYFRGHLYIAVHSNGWHWGDSHDKARMAGGYLATVADQAENSFLFDLFRYDPVFVTQQGNTDFFIGPYIGLVRMDKVANSRRGWVWVSGEELGYSNWRPGSPSNSANSDQYARFAGRASQLDFWEDWGDNARNFIMEIE